MGSCCSRPSSQGPDLGVAERDRPHYRRPTTNFTNESVARHARQGAAVTHKLGELDSPLPSGSLTVIPAAINKTGKGPEPEHVTHASSDNTGTQPPSLSSGCLDARHNLQQQQQQRQIHSGPSRVQDAPLPLSTVGSPAGLSHSTSVATDDAAAGAPTVSAAATAAASSLPARPGPKHALLSYAEQYRTLQPYLRRRFRNRRWRLIFSSEVHGQQLLDRCQRAFREEEAQWHIVLMAKTHHKVAADLDGPAEESSSASPTFGLLPLLALIETSIVVPAPKHAASLSATVHGSVTTAEGGEALAAGHVKSRPNTVVDSHVCVGLYLQHRPALDSVTSYRRSEVFFFLFQSPIHPTATVVQEGTDGLGAAAGRECPPVVSAPPQLVTQTSRHMPAAPGDVFCDEASRPERGAAEKDCTHRTRSYRLRDADLSPPVVETPSTMQVRREMTDEPNLMADRTRAFDLHGSVVEEQRTKAAAHVDPRGVPVIAEDSSLRPPTPTGLFSSQWRHQVERLAGAASPSPDRVYANDGGAELDEATFSSASAAAVSDTTVAMGASARRAQRCVTRGPMTSDSTPSLNMSDGTSTSPLRAAVAAAGVAAGSSPLMVDGALSAWAIAAANAVRSPNTPVSPHLSAACNTATAVFGPEKFVFTGTPSRPAVAHPPQLSYCGTSFTVDDDVVSASTTVVSATSVPCMAWREDEDLSSHWPDAAPTSSSGAGNRAAHLQTVMGAWRGREWYSPAAGPQLPLLSRVSSFGGDDTAECLTPRLPREGGSMFALPDGASRQGPSTPVLPARGLSPPLPGLSGVSAAGNASVASVASLQAPLCTGATRIGSLPGESPAAGVPVTAVNAATEPDVPLSTVRGSGTGLDGGGRTSSVPSTVRPVSTRVEVLPMMPATKQLLDGRVASGEGGVVSEMPSRTASQLVQSGEGTIDVYCTSAGALYVWDPHRERAHGAPAEADKDEPHAAPVVGASNEGSEHEFVYQRDAHGVRLNVGYFVREGYGDTPTLTSTPSSPVGESGPASLFAYLRTHAQQESVTASSPYASLEVVRCPLVRMQLCAISSRTMPSVLQGASSAAVPPVPSV